MTTSKIVPNTFQCFNDYVDRAMQHLTDAELRVLLFATRHILGWQDRISSRQARISLSRFEHGYTWKTPDGVEIYYAGCGLGRGAICKATLSLCEFGFLQKIGAANEDGQQWELGDEPNWSLLEVRTALRFTKNQARTLKGATVLAEKRAGGSSDELGGGGSSDDTTPGSSDDTGGGSSDEHNESHIQNHIQSQEIPAPNNGAEGDPPNPTNLTVLAKQNPMYDAIKDVFGYTAKMNGAMDKMLRGIATAPGWKEYNICPSVSPLELLEWASSYRKTELGGDAKLNMLENRMKIQSSITAWRELKLQGIQKKQKKKEQQEATEAAPITINQFVRKSSEATDVA